MLPNQYPYIHEP